jgi:molybdenum cofactor biosynthesis protein B
MVDSETRDTRQGTAPTDGEGDSGSGADKDGPATGEHDDGGTNAQGHDHDHEDGDDQGQGHNHGHGHHNDHGHDHDHGAPAMEEMGVAVVTVSSTRTLEDDASGDAIVAACEAAGASVEARELLPDEHDRIQKTVDSLAEAPAIDAVITTGGTGVTPDDVTVEAVRALFTKELPGFGELFRRYSEAEIDTRVVATRATAGIVGGVPVFCLPGSENAAELGTEEIVVPEITHLAGLAASDSEPPER